MLKKLCARLESNRDPQAKHYHLAGAFFDTEPNQHTVLSVVIEYTNHFCLHTLHIGACQLHTE